MTKAQLNAALDDLGIDHDPKATNPALEALLADAQAASRRLADEPEGERVQVDTALVLIPSWALSGPGPYDPNTLVRPTGKAPGKIPHGKGGHWVEVIKPGWAS